MKMTYTSPEAKLIGFVASEDLASGTIEFDKLLPNGQYDEGTVASANDIELDLNLWN